MTCYQLACGHWRDDVPGSAIGGFLHCAECNTLRVFIVGGSDGTRTFTPVIA